MNHDVYRPGGYRDRDRDRDTYDNRPRYVDQRPDKYDDRYAGRYNEDQHHPYEWHRSRSQSRSPPPRRPAPSPRLRDLSPPRRNGEMYRFGGGDNRANGVSGHNGRDDFTFRSGDQREFRSDPPPPRSAPPRGPRNQRDRGGRFNDRQPRRFGPKPAHERKILHVDNDREGTPERLEGMIEGASQFKVVNDLFVSDESDSESAMNLESHDGDAEPSAKRAKTGGDASAYAEKPKWSNPDPYYLIPPLDESRGKRKDVVQLLRKAKVEAEKTTATANAVTRNADFIGFGDEDEDAEADDADEVIAPGEPSEEGEIDSHEQTSGSHDPPARSTPLSSGMASHPAQSSATAASNPPGAPSFSHLRNLHNMPGPQTNGASNPTTQAPTPQDATIASDAALEDARQLLTEINAEDGVQPQISNRHNAPHGRKRKLGAAGEITQSWMAKDRTSSTPWYIDHSESPDIVYWLHQEICDFYEFIKPQQYEARIRQDLIHRIQNVCARTFMGSKVYSFGSYAQDIYLPTSDMDLVLYSSQFQSTGRSGFHKGALYKLRSDLVKAGIVARAAEATVIARAKVPIVKFVDVATGLNCDLSLDNDSGIKALATFQKWKRTWPFLPKLLSVLKQWLLMRDINEVFNGGLGGFSLTCMLVSMLQQRVDGQTQNLDSTSYLGELLLEFFDLYGNKFNMDRVGIDMPTAELFSKDEFRIGKDDRWTIIDPNNPENDLSGGSSQARLIQKKFSESHAALMSTIKTLDSAGFVLRKGQSFLRLIIGGNYERVVLRRSIMRGVHRKNLGPVDEPFTRGNGALR